MWKRLLELVALARRPLVFVDYETTDLGGAPPVEFAVLKYEPWSAPEEDETTTRIRKIVPPGLTYAASVRVDPMRPIHPRAQAKHGIPYEALRGCPRYDDPGIVSVFRGLATGDATANEGPAIWIGHNIANADAPWSVTWGYLPTYPAPDSMIDTRRVFERLQADHPRPLAVDLIADVQGGLGYRHAGTVGDRPVVRPCPAIGLGLGVFRSTLEACHVALVGREPEEQHAALGDCVSTARVFNLILELWGPLWPASIRRPEDPFRAQAQALEELGALVRLLGQPPSDVPSWDGWLKPDGAGGLVWAKGNKRGTPACADAWVRGLPRVPTGRDGEAWCSEETARLLSEVPGQRRLL